MSLIVNKLTKVYGSQKAVDDLSFEAQQGQILGFLGPNGAGKSTTMKIATGYLSATEGSIIVCGESVATQSLQVRRLIGYLPEHNPLYLDMYVKEYLEFVGNLYQLKGAALKNRIDEMIGLVGIEREQHKKLGTLSKGYRQRVGLAQALIHNPQVLILDEPTTGLDPNQIIEIRDVIRNISQQKTIIFSTHIMQEVQALCDKVVIINKGKKVWDGNVEALKTTHSAEWRIYITFDRKIKPALIEEIEGVRQIQDIGEQEEYEIIAQADIRPKLFHLAVQQGAVILELRKEEKNLETIFRQLTAG
jgi:ABC-2 type transport system ATP-binding protein